MSLTGLFPSPLQGRDADETDVFAPRFDAHGLLPAIVTDATSGEVLMLAHMNEDALRLTIETGYAHFWSRSRRKLWKKGESSGALLTVREIRTDCDQDTIWLKASLPDGHGACHTGRPTCFYRRVEGRSVGALQLAKD
ncbi:MAG: phosphoribosyl-AMP cyclohydrolase [Flavobacteriaceae bacterium]